MASKISQAGFFLGGGVDVTPLCCSGVVSNPPPKPCGLSMSRRGHGVCGAPAPPSWTVDGRGPAQSWPQHCTACSWAVAPAPRDPDPGLARRRPGGVRRVWKLVGGSSILALLIVVAVIAITGFPQAGGDGDLGGHRKVEAQAVHVHAAAVERARAGV